MKRLLTLALFAVLLLPAVAQELTVATYNIRNANKGDAERGNGWERRCPWGSEVRFTGCIRYRYLAQQR